MRLVANWRRILRQAWSVRMALVAALFSGAQIILPLYVDALPRDLFAALSFITAAGGVLLARVIDQPELRE